MRQIQHSLRIAVGLAALLFAATTLAEPIDRIVAVVNDDIILESELRSETVAVQQQFAGQNLPSGRELQRQVMERLIMKRLQLNRAAQMGITVDEQTLNAAVRRVAEQNNMSLPQFQQALQSEGIAFERFRQDLEEEIVISRLHQQQVERQVDVSQQEIDEFLATAAGSEDMEYRVSLIQISTPDAASSDAIAEARERAEDALAEIRDGEDFSQVAARVSDGQQALRGGDLGWRQAGQLPSTIADDVMAMDTGEVSEILRGGNAFYIVKLEDRRSEDTQIVTQTRARHILIQPSEVVSDQDAQARLRSLRERIVEDGESFSALAQAHSDDRGTASGGGDLSWTSPGQLVPAFQRAMDSLETGQISEPFQSQFGWHIVEVLDRREHDSTEDYRRARAASQIRERKGEEALEGWLRRLRDDAFVDNRLED